MTERYRVELPYYYNRETAVRPRWQIHGEALAEYLVEQKSPTMLLDQDGVTMNGGSFYEPMLITPHVIPALRSLEQQGVQIGPATARSMHIVRFLREHGLQMKGPGVLEEGHVFIHDGRVEYIAHPGHIAFVSELRDALTEHPFYKTSWDEVKQSSPFAFCHGNEQWQGAARSSFWYVYSGLQEYDEYINQEVFHPIIDATARKYGLDPQADIATKVTRMKVDNLAIFSVKGKLFGDVVDKSIAVKNYMENSWVFVADGVGDLYLAQITKDHGGFVIGIDGSLDISNEVPDFLRTADARLADPYEFAQTISYTAHLLAKK